MPWITKGASDIGGREEQQDRFLIEHSDDGNKHLLVVADGAGGHQLGAVAAQITIDCISENLGFLWSSRDPDTAIKELIIECNKRVLGVGGSELACTTLVMVMIKGDEIFWGHVGDSRFYLIRDRNVIVQTIDHSMIELQRQQAIEDSHIHANISSNKLYMCLGALVDITPEVASSVVKEGDTILLCSDGLWNQIDMPSMLSNLSDNPLTTVSANEWTEKAKTLNSATGDNITLVAAKYLSKPRLLSTIINAIMRVFRRN